MIARMKWGLLWLGVVVLVHVSASPVQAQPQFDNLNHAVGELVKALVDSGRLRGKKVFVGADDFFEEETGFRLRLPLSERLRTMCRSKLADYGVDVSLVEMKADRVVHGRWARERRGSIEWLHLTLSIAEPVTRGEPVMRLSEDGLVPIGEGIRQATKPDIEHWGDAVVRQLSNAIGGGAGDDRQYRLHVKPLDVLGADPSQALGKRLLARWRPIFARNRIALVGSTQANGELLGEVFVVGERIEVSLRVLDAQEGEIAAAYVEMDKAMLIREDPETPPLPELAAKASYEAAERVGTIAAYQEIADSFPDTIYAALAREQIAKLQARAREGFRDTVMANDVVQVKAALDAGVNVDAKDAQNRDRTALHDAAWEGNANVVKLLLNAGADIDVGDRGGQTPLHLAALGDGEDRVATVNALLESGAEVNARNDDRRTPLHYAWHDGEVARALIHGGADVDARDDDRNTPLHWASDDDVVWALVEAGADLESRNKYGVTALRQAAGIDYENSNYPRQLRTLKALIEAGADVNARDDAGETPLHGGALYDNADVVKALIEAGARVNVRDGNGETPLSHTGSYEVEELLRAAGGRR